MLDGKVALVTGSSSGIGAALSILLANEGASVVACARRIRMLEGLANQAREKRGRIVPLQCDVANRKEAESMAHRTIEEFGRIDILVNNAGRGHLASVEDTTDEVISNMFAVNVFPLWYTTRPSLVYMKRQKSGHIINIASLAGKIGYPYNSAYVAAKHACVGFTHALRQELVETGIHATVVCPAGVSSEWANATEGGSMRKFFSVSGANVKRIASERGIALPGIEGVKTPQEIANVILECIYHPVPEVFTHIGSKEFVLLATQDRRQAELKQLPIALGERETYHGMKGGT